MSSRVAVNAIVLQLLWPRRATTQWSNDYGNEKILQISSWGSFCSFLYVWMRRQEAPLAPPSPPVVTIEKPVLRSLESLGEFTGRLEAVEAQLIQAQVSGYLKEVKFKDGAIVQPGEVLYEIEAEPYQAALANAKAQVAKATSDIATLENQLQLATSELDRAKALLPNRAISQQEYDEKETAFETATTALLAAGASLDAAKASLRKAEFDLANCTIRAAIRSPGRVSRTEITPAIW